MSNMRSAHRLMVLYMFAKSFQNVTNPLSIIEQTRNTVIQCLTLNDDINLEHTHSNIVSSYIIYAILFVNHTGSLNDIERTRKCDEQTDGQTDGQTYNGAKNNTSPQFMGVRET